MRNGAVPLIFLALVSMANAQQGNRGMGASLRCREKTPVFLSTYGQYIDGIRPGRNIRIKTLHGEVGYYLWKNLAITGNVHLMETVGERVVVLDGNRFTFDSDTQGWGLAFGLRFDIIRLSTAIIFLEAGGGIVYTSDEFPPGGTDRNYTFRPGIGASVCLWEKINLTGGLRYLHLSNGKKGRGFAPNPAYDGFGVFIGMLYR